MSTYQVTILVTLEADSLGAAVAEADHLATGLGNTEELPVSVLKVEAQS